MDTKIQRLERLRTDSIWRSRSYRFCSRRFIHAVAGSAVVVIVVVIVNMKASYGRQGSRIVS